jgi:hypothetical protein
MMTKKLNELRDEPKWINSLTTEQKHEWYLVAKEIVERLKRMGDDTVELEKAIIDYEINRGIRS